MQNADALAGSIDAVDDPDILQSALTDGKTLGSMTGGYIRIGIMDDSDNETKGWDVKFNSQLPNNGNKISLPTTLAHEMLHTLGVTSASGWTTDGTWQFDHKLNSFDQHLYDVTGKQARPDMVIMDEKYYDASQNAQENVFFVNGFDMWSEESGVYFSGVNAQQVLNGARLGDNYNVNGIPVNGWEYDGQSGTTLDMSHLQLRNGVMSHYDYRNYSTFMEAELAVLQDLGYGIDLRDWFGRSIYNDGLTLVNDDGYSARAADGQSYLPGVSNTTAFGTGLHIYGSNNQITQAGDILTDGLAGIGIRVDGLEGNRVIVAKDTKILANGANGTGLLAAYGKNHSFVIDGMVTALGEGGIGARFDFGDNNMGNDTEYRGSYIWYTKAEYENDCNYLIKDHRPELDGALVDNFTVNGTLAGNAAAIYIAPNAFVKNINIANGAKLYGDIISRWGHFDEMDLPWLKIQYYSSSTDGEKGKLGKDLVTQLNFAADIAYDGNIIGNDNMQLNVNSGKMLYNGNADVLNVNVAQGAQLIGGSYTLNKQSSSNYDGLETGQFSNGGMIGALTPDTGDTVMYIDGDLDAKESKLQFTANKDYLGYIDVTGNVNITDTTLHIDEQGVYVPNKTYTMDIVRTADKVVLQTTGAITGSIDSIEAYHSGMLSVDKIVDKTITFTPQDNLGERTAVQQQMYETINEILMAQPDYNYDYAKLYSLDADRAKQSLTSLYGGVQSELATAVKQDRATAEAVYSHVAAAKSSEELWAVLQKGWSDSSSNQQLPQSKTHSFNVTVGQDKSFGDKWRAGVLLGYGKQTLNSGAAKGEADDVRIGVYGCYGNTDAANLSLYLAYGLQQNESKRQLDNLDLQAASKYNSDILTIGTQLSRTYPLAHKEDWSIRPYVGCDAAIYRMHGYTENGAGIYNQRAGRQSDELLTASMGMEIQRELGTAGSYALGVGYRRILNGADTPVTVSFAAGGTNFTTVGNAADKDILTLKLKGTAKVKESFTLSGELLQDIGKDTHRLSAGINATWNF